ncbi:MAG: hypothetical protein PHS53_01720 [Candidatus Pacebacteria bacterium]|nr:hypothetical protein [Candidatus Paceibacterota bacterium]MDD5356848.1 hypothetical protein [Candidatus Paceibacterota bacterium]
MFYLFYGTDRDASRAKRNATLLGAQKKRPDAEVFSMDGEDFSASKLQEFIGSAGLFEKKFIVCVDRIAENKEFLEILVEKLPEMKETENLFLILEGKLDAKTLEKYKKYAFKIDQFEEKKFEKPKFNVFALSDAFGRRDAKGLWALYLKALEEESAPEAIAGMLFWKIKTLVLSGSNRYSQAELEKYSSDLVSLYHDSHRGIHEFEIALERFVLGV